MWWSACAASGEALPDRLRADVPPAGPTRVPLSHERLALLLDLAVQAGTPGAAFMEATRAVTEAGGPLQEAEAQERAVQLCVQEHATLARSAAAAQERAQAAAAADARATSAQQAAHAAEQRARQLEQELRARPAAPAESAAAAEREAVTQQRLAALQVELGTALAEADRERLLRRSAVHGDGRVILLDHYLAVFHFCDKKTKSRCPCGFYFSFADITVFRTFP